MVNKFGGVSRREKFRANFGCLTSVWEVNEVSFSIVKVFTGATQSVIFNTKHSERPRVNASKIIFFVEGMGLYNFQNDRLCQLKLLILVLR